MHQHNYCWHSFSTSNHIATEDVTSPDIIPTNKTDSDAAVVSPVLAERMVFQKAAQIKTKTQITYRLIA